MVPSTATKPTTLVLGATGGSALAFLVRALNAGYNCSALVRTPSKLTDILESKEVSADVVARHLTIVQGNAKDSSKISEALLIDNRVVDFIVSGIGSVLKISVWNWPPPLDDPNICEGTVNAVLEAVRSLPPSKKPTFVPISTTGISDFGRDIPISMIPMYHWLLPVPHKDKKAMEQVLKEDAKSASPSLGGFIGIRPSFLTNGPELGITKVRVGLESAEMVESRAIGSTISRDDVGNWIFEEVLRRDNREQYSNRFVTITY